MSARKIAWCAIMVALLIAVQFALSFIPGVELVSVLLLGFCYSFGIVYGMLTASAFALLRCFLFGFSPNVIVLYLIYYNVFAVIFGITGKHRIPKWVCPVLLGLLTVASAYFALNGIAISVLYQKKISIMLWVICGISATLLLFHILLLCLKKGSKDMEEIANVTALATFCTVLFTLLDDVISPIFYGYSTDTAIAYFYTSFLSMLPQTICVAISVFCLFKPLHLLMDKLKP